MAPPHRFHRPPPRLSENTTPPDWYPDWTGETAVLVASGPSASGVDLMLAQGRARFITINNSWKLAPFADVLYACDARWWQEHRGVPEFRGLKVSQDVRAASLYSDIQHVRSDRTCEVIKLTPPGEIGWGGNSGFHAINLALQWKAKKIVLVGYDMHLNAGLHWHGAHTGRCSNPTAPNVPRWRRVVDTAYETVVRIGATGYNCSPHSALTAWPKVSFEQALEA